MAENLDLETQEAEKPRNPDGTFAPKAKEEATEVTPTSQPDPRLVTFQNKALELDFEPEEIEGLTLGALTRLVNSETRRRQQTKIEQERAWLIANGPRRDEPQFPQQIQQEKPQVQDEYNDEDIDPTLAKRLKAREAAFEKRAKELEDKLTKANERIGAMSVKSAVGMIDLAFDQFPQEYKTIIGDGPGEDLQESSATQFKRRRAILQTAGVDFDNLPSLPKLKKLLIDSYKELYDGIAAKPVEGATEKPNVYTQPPEVPNGKANGKIKHTPEEWNAAATEKPTHRADPEEVPGTQRAVKNMAKRMRSQGITPEVPAEDLNFVP